MRVIHIIPSAFDYFGDIRSQAFKLLDGLHKLGVDTEAFTLQYGAATKSFKESVKEDSPSVHDFKGNVGIDGVVENLDDFDIVHLHCPFLGAASKIINWKKSHPNIPLVITYYRDVRFEDLFSAFIKLYNFYFLSKIFAISSVVICQNFGLFSSSAGAGYMKDNNKLAVIDELELDKEMDGLDGPEAVAAKTLMVYNSLMSD